MLTNVPFLAIPSLDPGRGGCGIAEGDDEEEGMGLGLRGAYILVVGLAPGPATFAILELELGVGGIIEGIAGREGIVVDGGRPERTLPEDLVLVL